MKSTKLLITTALLMLTAAAPSYAQQRGHSRSPSRGGGAPVAGHAVPRGSVRPAPVPYRGGYRGYPAPYYRGYRPGYYYGYRPYYYGYGYGYPAVSFGYGYPYGAFSFSYGYGYPYGGYPYVYGAPYNPGYVAVVPGRSYGGVRIDLPERDAKVLVDGYYVGVVDNFDGNLQQLNLEPGAHRIEIELEGFQPASFDVNVLPGQTITYRTPLNPER